MKEKLHVESYTLHEIASVLGVEVEQLRPYLGAVTGDTFELHKRALHVYSEAERVHLFHEIAQRAPYPTQLHELGALMNQSQESCSKLYNCSCEELDTLCQLCIQAGSLGSRLTGAGWGGCTISLVPTEKLDSFLHDVRHQYYATILHLEGPKLEDPDILFSTLPGPGAVIYQGSIPLKVHLL